MSNRYTKTALPSVLTVLIIGVVFITPVSADTKQTSGWVEKVAIDGPFFLLHAKIDTGAKNSSIHAIDYRLNFPNRIRSKLYTIPFPPST